MTRIEYTEKAEQDLAAIIEYSWINWGAAQTHKYLDGLESLAAKLAIAPGLGRARQDIHKDLMVFPYESHLLFYRRSSHGITIVRILHSHMDTPQHFR